MLYYFGMFEAIIIINEQRTIMEDLSLCYRKEKMSET